MLKKNFGLLGMFFIIAASGCATPAGEKVLDQKIASEPNTLTSAAIRMEAQKNIDQDKDLSPDQSARLTALRKKTSEELAALRQQSLKLRSLLVKDFQAENDAEIDLIHKRLNQVSEKQVSVLFDAIRDANKILGHLPREHEWYERMLNDERGRF